MEEHHSDLIQSFKHINDRLGINNIEFIKNHQTNTYQPIKNPPTAIPPGSPSICFYAKPPVTPSPFLHMILAPVSARLAQLETIPAGADDFSPNHVGACMSIAHAERINSSYSSAQGYYETALRMLAHGNVTMALNRVLKQTKKIHMVFFHDDDLSHAGNGGKTTIAEAFAGLALCALYRNSTPQFVSFASAAGSWGGVGIVATLRMVAALQKNYAAVWNVSKNVMMPMLFKNKELYSIECELFGPSDLAEGLDTRPAPVLPPGAPSKRSRFVDGEFVSADHICSVCGAKGLMLCSWCRKVYYCGKECQIAGWKEHKKNGCEKKSV